jgi:hypothetical protein
MSVSIGGSSGKLQCELVQNSATIIRTTVSVNSVADGQWHHFVCVADKNADVMRIYDNGIEIPVTLSNVGAWPNVTDTTNLSIGRWTAGSDPGGPFDGTIDDVRIYNRALSAQEVKRLYQMGRMNP